VSSAVAIPGSGDEQMEAFHVHDATCRQQWQALLGTPIHGDVVRVTRRFYLDNLSEIHAIQIGPRLRS
jgi:hypothetical protein